jgi:hypothetical protein
MDVPSRFSSADSSIVKTSKVKIQLRYTACTFGDCPTIHRERRSPSDAARRIVNSLLSPLEIGHLGIRLSRFRCYGVCSGRIFSSSS